MESGWNDVGQNGKGRKSSNNRPEKEIEEAAADNRNHLIVLVS